MTFSENRPLNNKIENNIEIQETLEKEIFIMVQTHIQDMIFYLKSEEVQDKIINYMNVYVPKRFVGSNEKDIQRNKKILKRDLRKKIRKSIRRLKKIDIFFAKTDQPDAQHHISGQYNNEKHDITINSHYVDNTGELIPYDIDSFNKNKNSISSTVLHELWHATELDHSFQNDNIISLNLDLAKGYKNIIDYASSLRKDQYNKLRGEALPSDSQNMGLELGIAMYELESKINNLNHFFSVTMPFELYPRMKQLEQYLKENSMSLSLENLKKMGSRTL